MRKAKLEQLCIATEEMDKIWSLDVPDSDENDIVPCGDHRISVIEHACHELGHAILLDVPLGPNLSKRVAKRIEDNMCDADDYYHGREWNAADANEIETFGATLNAMALMGFECDIGTFADACQMQTGGKKHDIIAAIRRFQETARCGEVARSILRTFKLFTLPK